jgi:nucleolin
MSKKNTKNVQVSEESSEEVQVKKSSKPVQKRKQSSDSESDRPKKTVPVVQKKVVSKKTSDDEESSEVQVKSKPQTKKVENDDGETHSELFVKNLSWQSTEDSVYEYFSTFGTVTTVKLLNDKMTGKPKGIGFVAFENRADAKNALENIGEIDGRTPTCSWSNDKSGIGAPRTDNRGGDKPSYGKSSGDNFTIFVGNLGFNTNEQSIKKFFSRAGNIVGIRIAKHEDGKAKGFCHVDYDSAEAVQTAIGYAGQDLDGREVRVDASQPRQNRDSGFGGGRGRGGFGGGRGRGGFGGGRGRY